MRCEPGKLFSCAGTSSASANRVIEQSSDRAKGNTETGAGERLVHKRPEQQAEQHADKSAENEALRLSFPGVGRFSSAHGAEPSERRHGVFRQPAGADFLALQVARDPGAALRCKK